MAMDRRAKLLSTLSNIMKKLSDTRASITQNLKYKLELSWDVLRTGGGLISHPVRGADFTAIAPRGCASP
jgi:hypothetical protein